MTDQPSNKERRRQLFKQQQAQMLQGYNLNSFKTHKKSSQDTKRSNKPKEDKVKSSKHQDDFAEILDQMSLNSSINDRQNKQMKKSEPQLDANSKNMSGHISKRKHGYNFDHLTDMKQASLTINSSSGVISPDQINLKLHDQQFELNRQQFEEENPYSHSQKLNLTDINLRPSKYLKESRHASKEGLRQRDKKPPKVSAFEKYEEIRFEAYELQQKLISMAQLVGALTGDTHNINFQKQTMEVPLNIIEDLQNLALEAANEFQNLNSRWSDNFDEQQQSHTRERSKNKVYKKKLRELENHSQLMHRDHKEFEKSLQQISRVHSEHTMQMGEQLDIIEGQVSMLKNTRDHLNMRYEGQLDQAVKEMVNFYENIEQAEPGDADSDNMSIEQVFFIKPTHQISQTIQQRNATRNKSHLKLSRGVFSNDSNQAPARSHSSGPHKTPNIVPRLPIDKIIEPITPGPPQIIQVKQNSQRGEQVSQRNQAHALPPKSNRQVHKEREAVARSSRRESNQKQQKSNRSRKDEQQVDYVVNPVMVGAMQLTSKFDNKYEDDFDGANVTMDMHTDRIKQFPEDYEALNSIANPDERILLKQVIFMKYERILKKQAKIERKKKKKALKLKKEQEAAEKLQAEQNKQHSSNKKKQGELQYALPKNLIPTPTNKSSFGQFGRFQSHQSSKGSLRGANQLSSNSSYGRNAVPKGLGMNERPDNDNSQLTSRFSLQSELPPIDTIEMFQAKQHFRGQDVNRTELLECEEDMVHGMKTATQKSLIRHYEEEFRQKELFLQEIKQEEKKIDYSASSQSNSKASLINGKQVSSSGSKQHEKHNAICIIDSEEHSVSSDIKKRALDVSVNNPQQSVKSKKSSQIHIDNSVDIPPGIHANEKHVHVLSRDEIKFSYDSRRPGDGILSPARVNDSVGSGEHYLRYLENQDTPSHLIKNSYNQNSYVNSEERFSQQELMEQFENQQLDIEDFEHQNQIYLEQIGKEFKKQKLPLDVIQERQSEFSQSMITNARAINTNRSRLSRLSKNQQLPIKQTGVLPSGRSDQNRSSGGTRKNIDSFNNETDIMTKKTQDFEEPPHSVAQTHRATVDNSFHHNYSIDDRKVSVEVFPNSRNQAKKVSSSSKEGQSYLKMNRQPSVGNIGSENKQYFQPIEVDYKQVQRQRFKNKISSRKKEVPPTGKQKNSEEKRDIASRNSDIINKPTGQSATVGNNYINFSQNLVFSDQEGLYQQRNNYIQQPHSHRSQRGGDSHRDRSYFDESPAIFMQAEEHETHLNKLHDNIKDEKGSLYSQQVEKSIQSQLQSAQAYKADDPFGSSREQKFDSSIRTSIMQMNSIPQSSGPSTSRDNRSKQMRSKGSGKDAHQLSVEQTKNEIHLSSSIKEVPELEEEKDHPFPPLIRSNSECQLRDKEFYDMVDEDDEIAMYCKIAEQNFLDALHMRRLSQSNNKSPAQLSTANINILHANKSGSVNNQLVFLSQRTFKKLCAKYQTQDKTQIGHNIVPIDQATTVVDQNSSQQQTRGKRTFNKYLCDPTRLLASINGGHANQIPNYLGTNLLTTSLDDGTLQMNNIMNPTNQYNRRTLLMMQNLHNNYLYSANTGILFTMQRGWNSGCSSNGAANTNAQIGQSFKCLTNIGRLHKEFNNASTSGASALQVGFTGLQDKEKSTIQVSGALKSLGGEPVNISSLLMGAKQQTTDPINVGSITIVDDDGKFMIDRKLLLEAHNTSSLQTKGRKVLNQSRNINAHVTTTSDFSNLQTKQLGILRNNGSLFKQPRKTTCDSANTSQITQDLPIENLPHNGTPGTLSGCYGVPPEPLNAPNSEPTYKLMQGKQLVRDSKIMNLLAGLKQIQQRQPGGSQRSGSDLSNQNDNVQAQIKHILNQQKLLKNLNFSTEQPEHKALKSKSVPKTKIIQEPNKGSASILRKDKVKLVVNDVMKQKLQNSQKIQFPQETIKNFNTIIGTEGVQSNLKRSAQRTNSQCMVQKEVPVKQSSMGSKKASVATNGTSSARGSSSKKNNDNLYIDQNGKLGFKRKLNLRQFQSQQQIRQQ